MGEQQTLTKEQLRALLCKRVMAAVVAEGEAIGMDVMAACLPTERNGQVHLQAFGVTDVGEDTEEIALVVEVHVREPYRE